MLGRTISHYRIVSQIGAGGMGVVYGAEDVRLGRPVALKFVPEDLARDRQAVDRFRIEARAASALNHSGICTIYDIGEDEGRPFIVMELMKGQTLRDRLGAGAVKVAQLVDIGIQLADALDAAHAQGIVHRDVKPGNVFLTDRGQAKLMDFGLAKLAPGRDAEGTKTGTTGGTPAPEQLTGPGVTLGTVAYMSPEQVAGEELDGRTDIFSLGVVLYECATGHRPFTGNTSAVILAAILNRAPVAPIILNPDLPLRLQEVINNCLEKDRELRYQNAADLRADLRRVRRDLESTRSGYETAVSLTGAIAASERGSGSVAVAASQSSISAPAPGSGPSSASVAAQPEPKRRVLGAAAVGGLVLFVAVGSYLVAPRFRTAPEPALSAPPAGLVESRVELARRSLEGRDFRAALTYAGEVLASNPDHPEAVRIRTQAQTLLVRFEEAVAEARRLVASGEAEAAARALETARGIDPAGPGIAELSVRLADHFKGQADSARQELERSRSASRAPASAPARPPAEPRPGNAREPAAQSASRAITPPSPQAEARPAPPPPVAPAPSPAASPVPPREEPAPAAPQPAPRVVTLAAPATTEPSPTPARPAAPAPAERTASEPAPAGTTATEDDEAAIRRVIASYERAIETKDLALFRSVKPNLSAEEERRLEEGFRAVSSQQVNLTILSVERRGQEASVRLQRRDTIEAGGRRQTMESQQTLTLALRNAGWVIIEIGR